MRPRRELRSTRITITRRGVPAAHLVPATAVRKTGAPSHPQRVSAVFAALRTEREGVTLDVPLRDAIEHGRD